MNSIMFEAHTDSGSLKQRAAELQASRLTSKLQDQLKVLKVDYCRKTKIELTLLAERDCRKR